MSEKILKPHKFAFFMAYLWLWILLSALLFVPGLVILLFTSVDSAAFNAFIWFLVILFFLFWTLLYWDVSVRYQKTNYIFQDDKIINETGSLFADRSTELPLRNVTHVTLRLPFIAHQLFGTGFLKIESAGSSSAEGNFYGITDPMEMYAEVKVRLKANQFSVSGNNLETEMRPSLLAVFLETIRYIGISALVILYFLAGMISDDEGEPIEFEAIIPFIIGFGGIAVLYVLVTAAFKFFDLKKRVYRVYDDMIDYSEGFLSKNYSFIPFENLTDSNSTQSFWDRIFGLYDVAISCVGAGREIKFKNIINGETLSDKLRGLIHDFTEKRPVESKNPHNIQFPDRTVPDKNYDKSATLDLKMDAWRVLFVPGFITLLFAVLTFIIPAFGIFWLLISAAIFGGNLLQVLCTNYFVRAESMQYRYKFLSTKEMEFLNKKITGLMIQESWFDKIFGTCQLQFWSIGSAQKMYFRHIVKTDGLLEMLQSKVGIVPEEKLFLAKPHFNFLNLFRANLLIGVLVIFCLLGIGLLALEVDILTTLPIVGILLVSLLPLYVYYHFYYKRSGISFSSNYIRLKKGLLVQQEYLAAYEDIKDINATKYPFGASGKILFNVAGEDHTNVEPNDRVKRVAIWGIWGFSNSKTSRGFSLPYLSEIFRIQDTIDVLLFKSMSVHETQECWDQLPENPIEAEMVEKPDLINTLFFPVLIALVTIGASLTSQDVNIIAPVVIFWVLILLLTIWSLHVVRLEIQPMRVLKYSGIIYQKRLTVLFSKIDHINKFRGFFNKIFRNGNVSVHTIGSSKVELMAKDIDRHVMFYDKLKEKIGQK